MSPDYLDVRRRRDFGDMISITFSFLRQTAGVLLKSILAICSVPVVLAVLVFLASGGTDISRHDPAYLSMVLVITVLFGVTVLLLLGVAHAAVLLYVEKEGEEFMVGDVWNCIRENMGVIVFSSIASVFIIMLGYIFFIIPGIWLSIVLSPLMMVRFQEKIGFGAAFKRCRELMEGNWWFTFGFFFVLSIITGVLSYVFIIPGVMIAALSSRSEEGIAIGIIILALGYAMGLLLRIIMVIGGALQYYNLVERKDGTGGMERLIGQIGAGE